MAEANGEEGAHHVKTWRFSIRRQQDRVSHKTSFDPVEAEECQSTSLPIWAGVSPVGLVVCRDAPTAGAQCFVRSCRFKQQQESSEGWNESDALF